MATRCSVSEEALPCSPDLSYKKSGYIILKGLLADLDDRIVGRRSEK